MNGSPKSAVQRVADAVRYWSERLGGGAPLPSQEELAEQFGVSRDTVQKALKLLQEAELVKSSEETESLSSDRWPAPGLPWSASDAHDSRRMTESCRLEAVLTEAGHE